MPRGRAKEKGECERRSFGLFAFVLLAPYDIRHTTMTYVIFIYFSPHEYATGAESLIVPCEIAVKSVVPAVKALMAKELVETHKLRQDEVAKLLGISQSAVSKYTNRVRGHVINIAEVQQVKPYIDKMLVLLVKGGCQRREFLGLFCRACGAVRRTSLMCQFCAKANSHIESEDCGFCLDR